MTPRIYSAIFLLASVLLVIALAPLPYAFYLVLRPVVAVSACFLVARSIQTKRYGWLVPAVLAIGYFLPTFGVAMTKSQWAPIDFVSAAVFASAAFSVAKPQEVDLTKNLPHWHEEYEDANLEYPTEPSWLLIVSIAVALLLLLWAWTSESGIACSSWVQDSRGGYCEG